MKIKMLVGLSNPGKKYLNTRHNVGSIYIRNLSMNYKIILQKKRKFCGEFGFIKVNNRKIILFIPIFFMNLNGNAIFTASSLFGISLENMLIVHDEIDLSLGSVKLNYKYGNNGHNGLRSISEKFGRKNKFRRLSIGIGRPKEGDIASFVLNNFSLQEREKINVAINKSFLEINSFLS